MITKTYTNRQKREVIGSIGLAGFLTTHVYVGSITKRNPAGKSYTLHSYQVRMDNLSPRRAGSL